ncbi:hypothetical protein [Streptomyces sp. NPDC004008]
MHYGYDEDPYFDDEELDDEDEEVAGSCDAFIRHHDGDPNSLLTVRVSAAAGEDTGYAIRAGGTSIELAAHRDSGPETITVLGLAAPDSDPLSAVIDAAPGLLTFPPTAVVDIKTKYPEKVADVIRFSSTPESNKLEDLFGDASDDVRFDDLTPLRVRINRRLHFAAKLGDQWIVIPMTVDGLCRVPLLNRDFISISYDFDSGGMIGSGYGKEVIGEIRPGLNAYWDTFDGETYNLSLSQGDLTAFSAGHVSYSKFEVAIVEHLTGGLDHISDVDLEGYTDVTPSCAFEPRSEEGLRFLRTLRDLYADGSEIDEHLDAFIKAGRNR